MATDSALEVALLVAETFEKLGVDYLVGGSLASSLHGEPRSTQDVDFVADLRREHVPRWIALLGEDFYVDEERVKGAIRRKRSFNIIHLATMFKADIFIPSEERTTRLEMSRREHYELAGGRGLWVASAEDIVIQKLIWFRLGNEVSDRQWRDVLAVIKVRGEDLDRRYLDELAEQTGLGGLLQRAFKEAQ